MLRDVNHVQMMSFSSFLIGLHTLTGYQRVVILLRKLDAISSATALKTLFSKNFAKNNQQRLMTENLTH